MKYNIYVTYDDGSIMSGSYRRIDSVEYARKYFTKLIDRWGICNNVRAVFKHGSRVLAVHRSNSLPWDDDNWTGRVDQIGEQSASADGKPRKPGRPASADVMVNLSVRVSVGDADTIRRVGDGNASEGVRRLVAHWNTE